MPDNSTMELVDGHIVEKHAGLESSDVELELGTRFRLFLRDHPVARAFPASLGYQCYQCLPHDPERVREPDCNVVLNERLAALADPNPGYMPIVPDLAVEVVSPNDKARLIATKIREPRLAGFALLWVVKPSQRIVTVYPDPDKIYTLSEDDEIRAESALPGFVCKVSDLFPEALGVREP
jgi:Uma2 family endonuclease